MKRARKPQPNPNTCNEKEQPRRWTREEKFLDRNVAGTRQTLVAVQCSGTTSERQSGLENARNSQGRSFTSQNQTRFERVPAITVAPAALFWMSPELNASLRTLRPSVFKLIEFCRVPEGEVKHLTDASSP